MTIAIRRPLLAAAVFLSALPLGSQQSASTRVPQFENSDVSVWKTTIMPHAPLTMHTHEHPRVIVALQGGTVKIVYADGGSETQRWETGKAYYLSTEEGKRRHADANAGEKPIEVMVVELKNAK